MEAENLSKINEEKKNDDSIENFDKKEKSQLATLCLFCNDCLQIPAYEIDLRNGEIYLMHVCNGNKKKLLFQSEIKNNTYPKYPCIYCNKKCNIICIECHKNICEKCKEKHLPDEPDESNEIPQMLYIKDKKTKPYKKYIMPYNDIQLICKTHFIKYEYFCPICKINLCEHCKNYHFHINCSKLSNYDIIANYKKYSGSDDIINNLTKLCKLFEECYKESCKNEKLTINKIMNYFIINNIHNFINKYEKTKNRTDKIANTIFKKEKESESNYVCASFYGKKFRTEYSELIKGINDGNYEYYFKMNALKLFYKKMNRISSKHDWDNSSFFSSLKGIINFFRNQYHHMKEIISDINKDIKINYIKKDNENLNLLLKVYETDLNLLKKINMSLLYKFDFQLRRKAANLFAELLILNNTNILDEIEETDYIIMETLILLKKKISLIKNLDGPNDKKEKYEKDLTDNYKLILDKANSKVLKQLENLAKENPYMEIINEDEEKIQFHQLDNENNNINDAVLINLFFRLKASFASIFNQSIHNETEKINAQIKDELKKFKKANLSHREIEIKNGQDEESNSKINIEDIRLCDSYLKKIKNLKNKMNIKTDITLSKNENILKLFEPIKQHKYIDANVNQFKSELEYLFKYYDIEDTINIQNASEIIFRGNILNSLMEKKIYQNYQSQKIDKKSQVLEKAKKDFTKDLAKIEPTLDKYLEKVERLKNKSLSYIKQVENNIDLDKIKMDKIEDDNPFLFLEKFEDINLFGITSEEVIENAYFSYLINFYFCAEDISKYLRKIKDNYKDAKLFVEFDNIFEKSQLLKNFDSKIKYEENDELKEKWKKLRQEKDFVKGNEILNQKIKEYLEKNDECQYLKDLNNMNQLKDAKIILSLPEPQHLSVKAYWLKKGIPWNIPEGLKNTEMEKK